MKNNEAVSNVIFIREEYKVDVGAQSYELYIQLFAAIAYAHRDLGT